MIKPNKCRECANFIPIGGTVYGRCRVRPFAKKQGGQLTDREFITSRGRAACKGDFVKADKLPEVIKECRRCKKSFPVTEKSRRVFCCDECRERWHREKQKRERAGRRAQKKKAAGAAKPEKTLKRKKGLSIGEINALALAEHLSYGEYVMKYGL